MKDQKIIIRALADANISITDIANQIGIHRNTVGSFVAKYNLLKNLPPKIKKYKGKIQGRKQLQILKYIKEHPMDTRRDIIDALDLGIVPQTLSNYFKHQSIVRKKARRSPMISANNRAKRIAFAKEMLTWTNEMLRNILWSDETTVKSYPNGEIIMYRDNEMAEKRYDIVSPAVQQGGISVQFWGCISFHATGPLVEFDGWVNAQSYFEVILEGYVVPELRQNANLVFQQDNAKPHKAPFIMEWFSRKRIELVVWPPQSPDLSPIEVIWNIMKMKLKSMKPRPRSKKEISAAMHKIWTEIDDTVRQQCCDKFRDNLKRCLEVKGYPIFKKTGKHIPHRDCHTDIDEYDSMDDFYEE
jgi:transposase